MEVGQLGFQIDMVMGVATNVARAARTGPHIVERLFHCRDHLWMLPHAEIVVGAPDGDWLRTIMPRKAAGIGKSALVAKNIDKDAIATFFVKAVDRGVEDLAVIQGNRSYSAISAPFIESQRNFPARMCRKDMGVRLGLRLGLDQFRCLVRAQGYGR